MECLIRKYDTWMDLSENVDRIRELIKGDFKYIYDMRERKGDIIEVRPDGYWSKDKGYDGSVFELVCCLGEDLKGKDESLVENEITLKKRRYSLSNVSDKMELTKVDFDTRLTTKTVMAVIN